MRTVTERELMRAGDATGTAHRRPKDSRRSDGHEKARQPSQLGLAVGLLTGGGDKPYALGMASALAAQDIRLDFIGSDEIDGPGLHGSPLINFFNLRGSQKSDVSIVRKVLRLLVYYWRLILYAASAEPRVFHILWNEKFIYFDRTALMLYLRLLGKKIAFTAHNVNAGKRDGNDSLLNRISLRIQYNLADHIFVHTGKMKRELVDDFRVPERKTSVIPFGINNTLPDTRLSASEARRQLGVSAADKTMLFFGNIAPYKGLEHLIAALGEVLSKDGNYRLIIAGRATNCEEYWSRIKHTINRMDGIKRIIVRIEYIPDDQVEVFFKAADVLILPYTHIFQSGVLFLGYSFGLPVIAADVGSLREDIVEGETGYVFRPKDPGDLAKAIETYFASPLYRELEVRRPKIRDYANTRYSWTKVGEITRAVYESLLNRSR